MVTTLGRRPPTGKPDWDEGTPLRAIVSGQHRNACASVRHSELRKASRNVWSVATHAKDVLVHKP